MAEHETKIFETEISTKVYSDILFEVFFGVIQFITIFPGGVFLTGYLLTLGANNTQVGIITSIPMIVNIFAPFVSHLVDRAESKKMITLRTSLPQKFLWVVVALIPLLVYYNGITFPLLFFVGVFLIINIINVPSAISWTSWMGEIIPEKVRGYYMGRRSIVAGLVGMIAGILLGIFLDYMPSKHVGFSMVYLIGAAAGFMSYYYFTRLPDTRTPDISRDAFSLDLVWKKTLKTFANKNFMNLVWFNVAWAFGIAFMNVYLYVFMIKELKLGYTLITMIGIVGNVSSLSLMPFWGRIADKYGNKPVMLICANIIGFTPYVWAVTTTSNYFVTIPVLYAFSGLAWAGFNIAVFNIVFKLAPKEDRSFYLSVNMLLPSIAAFAAPLVSGFIIDSIGTNKLDFGFYVLGGFQVVFILGIFMRGLPIRLLKKVKEPQEENMTKVRQSVVSGLGGGFLEGMGVLFSYMFFPVAYSGKIVGNIIKRRKKD